ncbi:MAG: hypothetical protein NVS1B7_4420 [Candidatus Saccharimonadales bacterium]
MVGQKAKIRALKWVSSVIIMGVAFSGTWLGTTLVAAVTSLDNAAFVSQNVPTSMSCGTATAVAITMTNSGSTTWTAAQFYQLTAINPLSNTTWGNSTIALPTSVVPGASVTFNWSAIAPSKTGTYNFQWQLSQNGVVFGAPTTNIAVNVSCTLDNLFSGKSQFVSDASFSVDRPDLFRNTVGANGHAETSTVYVPTSTPAYRMFYRTFINPDGTSTTNGVPAGIALATSTDGNNWNIYNGGRPVLATRSSTLQTGLQCNPAPCVTAVYAPSVLYDSDKTLKMMYETLDTGVNSPGPLARNWIEAASSTDGGVTWTPFVDVSGKPQKVVVAQTDWEGFNTIQNQHTGNVGTPDLTKVGNVYYVSYHGFNGTNALQRGMASGTSLTNLSKFTSNPSFRPSSGWSAYGPGKGADVQEGNYFYRVFEAFEGTPNCGRQDTTVGWGIARSTDRVTWEYSGLNPIRQDRVNYSCGEDMPAWQILPGKDPMVITTNIGYPLTSQATVRRYSIQQVPTSVANATVVSMGQSSQNDRYWELTNNGGVYAFGAATFYGDALVDNLTNYVSMTARPTADGYWLVNSTGTVRAFGAAVFLGDLTDTGPSAPIVGMERTSSGNGYWLVGSDGAVYPFGDAVLYGQLVIPPINAVVSMVSLPAGNGYWLVGSDGAVYPFGAATNVGDLTTLKVVRSNVIGMSVRPDGLGYWIAAQDGTIWAFGTNTANYGSTSGYQPLGHFAITAISRRSTGTGNALGTDQSSGYYLVAGDGAVIDFGNANYLGHVRGLNWNL